MGWLAMLTSVAASDVFIDKVGHAQPPIEVANQLKGRMLSKMSCRRGVMTEMYYTFAKFRGFGNIDSSFVEDETIVFFPVK